MSCGAVRESQQVRVRRLLMTFNVRTAFWHKPLPVRDLLTKNLFIIFRDPDIIALLCCSAPRFKKGAAHGP